MNERKTPCTSPARLRSGLPPSVQMPHVSDVGTKYCQCQACKQKKLDNMDCSINTHQIDNIESNLTKLEKGFDELFKRNLQATSTKPCCSHQCRKLQERFGSPHIPKFSMNNQQQRMEMNHNLIPQHFRTLGLTGGYERWRNVFNNGVLHFISEIIFIFVIVLVATMAVWIAFFQFMHRLAITLHQSRNRHIKTVVLVLVGILLISIVSGVVRDRYKEIQLKRAKMHKKSEGSILLSWKQKPPVTRHWYSLPKWGVAQKPCEKSKPPGRSYKFWQSSCVQKKKKSYFKTYFQFSKPPPPKTLRERVINIIFFWQKTEEPPKRNWLGIIVYQKQTHKPQKRQSWSSKFRFSKKEEKKGWFLQKRHDLSVYWISFMQRSKQRWTKFHSRLQEAHRKRNLQKSCGCKSNYYFWTKQCPAHKMQEEKINCGICRLKMASKLEQDRVKELNKARKRAKLYTLPLDMKTPPPLLTYFYNELFNRH